MKKLILLIVCLFVSILAIGQNFDSEKMNDAVFEQVSIGTNLLRLHLPIGADNISECIQTNSKKSLNTIREKIDSLTRREYVPLIASTRFDNYETTAHKYVKKINTSFIMEWKPTEVLVVNYKKHNKVYIVCLFRRLSH